MVLGGPGKTVQVDECFLTKRKYHRGRYRKQMSITVLGLYCKEDKSSLFFEVNSKSKRDLWPYIRKYVHPNTSRVCTDAAKQYYNVESLFSEGTVHMITNHSKGEYVGSDPLNTINDLENQNKLLKRSILCRRTTKHLHQYMALYFYKNHFLSHEKTMEGKIMQVLEHIRDVYPGYRNGKYVEGLKLNTVGTETNEEIVGCHEKTEIELEIEQGEAPQELDDDGKWNRDGVWTEGTDHEEDGGAGTAGRGSLPVIEEPVEAEWEFECLEDEDTPLYRHKLNRYH